MKQCIITYTYAGLSSSTKNKVRKNLLGHRDTQKQQKYSYKKPGIMQKISHTKLQRAVFLISQKDIQPILELFDLYKVKYTLTNI